MNNKAIIYGAVIGMYIAIMLSLEGISLKIEKINNKLDNISLKIESLDNKLDNMVVTCEK